MTFELIGPCREEVLNAFRTRQEAIFLVSRHGLGDNIFCSPCFARLRTITDHLYFSSSVNAYTSIFHESDLVKPLYIGGTNSSGLGLKSGEAFVNHFRKIGLPLPHEKVLVYHFGEVAIEQAWDHPGAFVKGRRNQIEFFGEPQSPVDVPRYHVAPDLRSRSYVAQILDEWLPGRELICIARYGHTDSNKNFGHSHEDPLETVRRIDRAYPDRFKFLSFDYTPHNASLEGHLPNVRSVYGFLPCDAASQHHILCKAKLLITVPTGPMLVGSTIKGLILLTIWKSSHLKPYHFLDPQSDEPVYALVENERQIATDFTRNWTDEERQAVLGRWKITRQPVTPENVAACAIALLRREG